MKFCDEHPNVSQWASEAVKIPYRNPLTGKYTVYVPDFFIVYADKGGKQKVELIEVCDPRHMAQNGRVTPRSNCMHMDWDVGHSPFTKKESASPINGRVLFLVASVSYFESVLD